LIALCSVFLLGAAPSRTEIYTAGEVIDPADVTTNEDNIFSYLQAGVDTIRNNAVETADIQDDAVTTAKLGTGAVTTTGILDATVATGDIANNAIDGTKLGIGSAQGDVLYYDGTDWARLGAGTSGQFLKTNGASANPAWDAAVDQSTIVTFTRSTSGTEVAYTGMGFQPTAVWFFCDGSAGEEFSYGFADDSAAENVIALLDNGISTNASTHAIWIADDSTPSNGVIAVVVSLDADGFTLTWTASGTAPTATCAAMGIR